MKNVDLISYLRLPLIKSEIFFPVLPQMDLILELQQNERR